MKPYKKHCQKYCDLYPCDKKECDRKMCFNPSGDIFMVDKQEYERIRKSEKKSDYRDYSHRTAR